MMQRRRAAARYPATFTLADTSFVPYTPKSTADATQMGWYKSKGGLDYTVFFWPKHDNVYTVHNSELEPVDATLYTTKAAAVSHIQTELDVDVSAKQPLPERNTTWLFSQALDGYGGVDTWGGDRLTMNHRGDWVRLKGVTDYGGKFSVSHVWEKGDASKMPVDFDFDLKPGERKTLQNMEGDGGAYYNVDVMCNGALYTYKGQQAEEAAAGVEPQPAVDEVLPTYMRAQPLMFNGPFMQRIRALIAARRGG